MTVANLGNMPLYSFRGPGVKNWNTSVYKTFQLKERMCLIFRAEAYNTFNPIRQRRYDDHIQRRGGEHAQQLGADHRQPGAAGDAIRATPGVLKPASLEHP
jgi:hypothetical protein